MNNPYRPSFFIDEKPRCAACGNPTPDKYCALCSACEAKRNRDADFFMVPLPDDEETYGKSFKGGEK